MNPLAKAGASSTHSKRSARPDGRGSREAFGVRPARRRFRFRGPTRECFRGILTLTLSLEALVSTQVSERGDFRGFLPLLLTQEGGEGWGEEAYFPMNSPLPGPLPTRSSRGEGTCVDANAPEERE